MNELKKCGSLSQGQIERTLKTIKHILLKRKECVAPKFRWSISEFRSHIQNNFFVTDTEWHNLYYIVKQDLINEGYTFK